MPSVPASPTPPSSPHRSLLRDRPIALVWASGLASWLGNHALFVAIPFAVYVGTGSPVATAAVVLANVVPPVLVSQVAGVIADRADRRRVLIIADIALAILTLGYLVPGGWAGLVAVSFIRSAVGQLVGPAEHALLPELAPRDRLGELASLNALNNSLARLAGPALGGVLVAVGGLHAAAVTVAACHGLSALLVLAVRHRSSVSRDVDVPATWWQQWRSGWRAMVVHPVLSALLAPVLLMGFGEGFVAALLAPFLRDALGIGGEGLGIVLSAQAVGGVIGAGWASRIADRRDPLRLLGLAAVGAGGILTVLFVYPSWYPEIWPTVVGTACAGAPFAVIGALQGMLLQTQSPAHLRGRVFTVTWGLSSAAQILGIAAAGLLAERFGSGVILVDAVMYLLAGALVLRTGRQRIPTL